MIILGNYKNNYDIATKTAQWALTPKQLNLVSTQSECQFLSVSTYNNPTRKIYAYLFRIKTCIDVNMHSKVLIKTRLLRGAKPDTSQRIKNIKKIKTLKVNNNLSRKS